MYHIGYGLSSAGDGCPCVGEALADILRKWKHPGWIRDFPPPIAQMQTKPQAVPVSAGSACGSMCPASLFEIRPFYTASVVFVVRVVAVSVVIVIVLRVVILIVVTVVIVILITGPRSAGRRPAGPASAAGGAVFR